MADMKEVNFYQRNWIFTLKRDRKNWLHGETNFEKAWTLHLRNRDYKLNKYMY